MGYTIDELEMEHRSSLQPENALAILRDVRRFLNERQDIDFPQALYQRIDAAIEGRPALSARRVA